MKIMDIPAFGPMFRFSDANVYHALYILADGKRVGRKKLAEMVGVGEGSMRRILEKFREWNFVVIKQTGISITKQGMTFLEQIPLRMVTIPKLDSVIGEYQQAVIVYGVASRIDNGMRQRDAGIKVGAEGCTTIVLRDDKLLIPPDWNLDEQAPEVAYVIRKETNVTSDDAIIIGGGSTPEIAIGAALSAAFDLI